MCGIVGLWGKGDIHKMADVLAHRGPDSEGFYLGEKVKLGAKCLKITDRLLGDQPLFNEDKTISVVLNGEIYNYLELKKELKGHVFKTNTDTEVIVHAYEEYGTDCVNKFNGQFAFALWDGKNLFLGRDRLGKKPLYYYHNNGCFIFASEIKSILTEVVAIPNITENFEVFETPLDNETLFKNIFSLPAACILTFDGSSINIRRYWQITSDQSILLSEEQYIEKLRWLIEDAVRLRIRCDVPFGLYLSGGLDSSLIAYLAKPHYIFSSHYDLGGHFDELRYAQMVVKEIGAEHSIVRPTPLDFQKFYEKIIWHLDYPIATASSASAFFLAKEASKFVKVVLNGEGGDELFGGYIRYLLMAIESRLSKIPEINGYYSLAKYFWNDRIFNDPAERYFELTKRGIPRTDLPLTRIKNIFARHKELINQMSACDIEITLPSLLILADRSCGAFGLENRSPYLDYRIVEFAFSLPPEMKIKDFQTKYILRKLARGIVPDEIIERKDKKGLVTPIFKWFSEDLFNWSNSLINSFKQRGVEIKSGRSRGEYDRYLYTLLSLELWYRNFIDAKEHVENGCLRTVEEEIQKWV